MKQDPLFLEGAMWAISEAIEILNKHYPSPKISPCREELQNLHWDINPNKEFIIAENARRIAAWEKYLKEKK